MNDAISAYLALVILVTIYMLNTVMNNADHSFTHLLSSAFIVAFWSAVDRNQ